MMPPRASTARPRLAPRAALLAAMLPLLAGRAPAPARAADAPRPDSAAAPTHAPPAAAAAVWEKIGLPHYEAPASYSEDLVITSAGQTMVMKRAYDKGRSRTEMSADGQNMVMIELGDERGTTYQLMPDRKEAMKQSRRAMNDATGGRLDKAEAARAKEPKNDVGPPPDMKVEDLGDDATAGAPSRKLRLTSSDGVVLAWFEKATGAPLRMESTVEGKSSTIEWKNRKVGPQAASLFEVPKSYKVQDMDEMMAKMKAMSGMGSMAQGMASGLAQGMGSNLGASFGASLGASLGGPLGAVAGQYIGGRIGGMIGKKAGSVVP